MNTVEKLLKVLDCSLNGIMVLGAIRDERGDIIDFEWQFVNSEAAKLVDRRSDELQGKRLLQVMPENKEFGLFDKYVQVVNTGEPTSFDIHYEDQVLDRWFRVQAVKLEDGFVVTFLDISNLKRIESELVEKEGLLSEAQDLANLGSWSWNLVTDQVMWSSKMLDIYGIEDPDFQPTYQYFIERLREKNRPRIEQKLQTAIENKQPYELDFQIQVGKAKKHLEARAIPKIAEDGALTEYIGIVKDVTADKEQQAYLKQAQRKAYRIEKAASTERMARSIAHEIRNPLTNITLATEQLRSESDEETKELFLDMITRNGRRVEDLIKKLMDSAQQAELEMSGYNINDLLDEAITLAMDRIKLRGVSIDRHYESDMCEIQVDGEKVKVALLNIIINAIEAISDKGLVKIETKLTDSECIVSISDDGIGIEEEQMSQLFDPFYTGKKRGLGLGLTTTLNILNSHDANLEVDSTPGEGAKFTLYFKR